MARLILALALCSAVLAAAPVAAQSGNAGPALNLPPVAPAPYDSATGTVPAPVPAPVAESKPLESAPPPAPAENAEKNGARAESKPEEATPEAKAAEKADGRFTFSRMDDGYVRLDNRTGQVSFCGKRTVGWTCQLAADDRGVLENEIGRLQEENASLKRELLTNGLPLPGSMKGEPPLAQNGRSAPAAPSDPNIERMKVMVEKAWRRLVDLISALQKEVLKKS